MCSIANFASSGNAVGYDYDGRSHVIAIQPGPSPLTIDPNSGAVTLDVNPDFETKSDYSFDVIATDAAGYSDRQSITLSVNDINENPMITSSDIGVVLEGSGADHCICGRE